MNYWLMKSEPDAFSIEDLTNMPKKTEFWDGVRNYQARNMMRDEMKKGDLAFFYHSNCSEPGIVGTMKVVKEGYPDETAYDPKSKYFDEKSTPDNPRWFGVEVKHQKTFKQTITLPTLRQTCGLEEMFILRKGNRLSITPISESEWDIIMALAMGK